MSNAVFRVGINLNTIGLMRKAAVDFMKQRKAENRMPSEMVSLNSDNLSGVMPIRRIIVIDDNPDRIDLIKFTFKVLFRPKELSIPHGFYTLPTNLNMAITNDPAGREEILAAGGNCAILDAKSFGGVFAQVFIGNPTML